MDKQEFASAATGALGRMGAAAHQAIGFWREGAGRLGAFAGERWDTAFAQASPRLDAQTRRNAKHLKTVVSRCWARAVTLSAGGAEVAVDTAIGAAIAGVERVAAYRHA